MRKFINYLTSRKFINDKESKNSYLQLFGSVLILLGVISIICFIFSPKPSGIAISFFIIMLGVAFAFPKLLEGNDGLSTMRIVVFMMINVICMLLLKIGWGDKITSLSDIGLNSSWVGVIAFVFGAKATQSYFENANKLNSKTQSVSQDKTNETGTIEEKNLDISQIAIAQLAKVQNEDKLHEKFPSIEFASDTLKDGESCLTLYLNDNDTKGIPAFVNAEINETTVVKVQTEIVSNIGEGKPHIAQLSNNIADNNTSDFLGSICCMVESTVNSNLKGVLTSGHIFTGGKFIDFDGLVNSSQAHDTLSNGNSIGELYFQQMISNQDIAIVKLTNTTTFHSDFKKFTSGFYKVSLSDLNSFKKNVTILSKDNNQRDAFIVDVNVSMRLYYDETQKIMRNIILIGSNTDKNKSTTVSTGGDSGSCVYHKESEKMIGMLLGGNDKFSFVLPFEQTLINNNFKLK